MLFCCFFLYFTNAYKIKMLFFLVFFNVNAVLLKKVLFI